MYLKYLTSEIQKIPEPSDSYKEINESLAKNLCLKDADNLAALGDVYYYQFPQEQKNGKTIDIRALEKMFVLAKRSETRIEEDFFV